MPLLPLARYQLAAEPPDRLISPCADNSEQPLIEKANYHPRGLYPSLGSISPTETDVIQTALIDFGAVIAEARDRAICES